MSVHEDGRTYERLSARDWRFVALCLLLAAAAVAIVVRYFEEAYPQASIEFRYDRGSSKVIAEQFAKRMGNDLTAKKHAVRFDSDDQARIFLERSLGLKEANAAIRRGVRVWYWHHRWFTPLVEEEIAVDVAPTGEIVAYSRNVPEARTLPDGDAESVTAGFLRSVGVDPAGLTRVSASERRLPGRIQRIFTFESKSVRAAGAAWRHTVTLDGGLVTGYSQQLKVPESWIRSYRELRSKNAAAGSVDVVLNAILLLGATAVFVGRLRRGDLPARFLFAIGIASVVLVGGLALNSVPSQLAWYDTTTSWPAFVGQVTLMSFLQSVGTAMLLIVVCGAGEALYRERLPHQLAMPRLWSRKAIGSRRVFLSLVLGYALVPMFMAYQAVFYLTAQKFGAWSPADVPYDDMLNSALPWVAVLFAGFFPALSEEFLSRAFAIPFLQKALRSRLFAIVVAAFIWGFGHSTYPNQPFWIRGVEVGLVGIVAGVLMDRVGLLPLLVWHYTIDAVYTAAMLFTSGNRYYVVSAGLASLVFALPLAASVFFYLRHRGFAPDDELTNASIPTAPPREPSPPAEESELPPPIPPARRGFVIAALAIAIAAILLALRPATPRDALDYRITKEQAKDVARTHLDRVLPGWRARFRMVFATSVDGFRSWNPQSTREDGGGLGGFDSVAAGYLVRNGMSPGRLNEVFRREIEAGNYAVRFVTPGRKEEVFVEVDPRSSRVIAFHRYLEEKQPGAALGREEAARTAAGALEGYGVDPRRFELREALSFQQPARRDWLLHFQERSPLAGDAWRRVTVRVSGAEVTHVARHVHIPASVYHDEGRQTMLNVVLLILKIGGIIALLSLAIAGLVIATRHGGLPWRRPLRWTAFLALAPIVSFAAQYERILFRYNTLVAWDTFRVDLVISFVRDVGLQAGIVFLSLAGLEAAMPWSLRSVSGEGRRRFGRSALLAALTAVAIFAALDASSDLLASFFPGRAAIALEAPAEVSMPWPAAPVALRGLVAAVVVSAGAALYATSLRRKAALVTIVALFGASVDPLATAAQAPLSAAGALLFALAVWFTARYVLGTNPLAWPLAVFLGVTLEAASTLLRHHRPDLLANGIALVIVAALAAWWAGAGKESPPAAI